MSGKFQNQLFSFYASKYGSDIVIDQGMAQIGEYIADFKDRFEEIIDLSDEIMVSTASREITINNVRLLFVSRENGINVIMERRQIDRSENIDVLVPNGDRVVSEWMDEGEPLSEELFDNYLRRAFQTQME